MSWQRRISPPLRSLAAYHVPSLPNVVAKLDANEFPYRLPEDLANELAKQLAAVNIGRYPDASGKELRAVIAAAEGVEPEQIVLGNGSDELIAMLVNAFANATSEQATICYPVPTFVYYRLAAANRGVATLEVPLQSDFSLNESAVIAAIEANDPALVFLALPNNPTGTLWRLGFARELAVRFPDTIIVADEAYLAYSGVTTLDEQRNRPLENFVILRTLAKVGFAGLRVGFAIVEPAVAAVLEKVRPPYNVSSLNQVAATFALTSARNWYTSKVSEVRTQRAWLAEQLNRLPNVTAFPSEANLVLVRFAKPGLATGIWQHLREQGVLVRNFDSSAPGNPLVGCLRITVGTPAENVLLLEAVHAALAAGL